MSIRIKLLLAIALAVLLTTASILATASFQLKTALSEEFEVTSRAQLDRMNAFVNMFFSETIGSANLIATSPAVLEGVNHMTSYAHLDVEYMPVGENLQGLERGVFNEVNRFDRLFPAYVLVYVGHSNGGFVQSPNDTLGKFYNPPERPWFIDTIKAGKPIVTEAYLSDSGDMVCTVTAPVDTGGDGLAVAGIDIELGRLSTEVANVTIGKTGYLMMLDHMGQIVADPKSGSAQGQRQWLGKAIAPVPTDDSVEVLPDEIATVMKNLVNKKQGFTEVRLEGAEWLAGVTTTEQGWTLIMLQQKDEIFADAFSITFKILEVGAIIAAVLMVFAYLVARSIAKPVGVLSQAAQKVAEGDLNAIPKDAKGFTGELGVLHASLQRMVSKLVELIETAEGKIKEAEAALGVSKNALEEAEEAKNRADRARGEAILETATRLASVVEQLANTAHELEKGAKDSTKNVDNQRDRLANTAAAINQMNITVSEVASNIASTANLANEARQGAITGKALVLEVVESVQHLENSSTALNQSLESLGTQVSDIGQIMGVINDIADQTNLLALNAAIEAARAGEAGRGFAVVADEVRKLAESTVNATKQVGSAIVSIQKGTEENRKAMTAASEAVVQSTTVAAKAGEAIGTVEQLVVHTADNLRAIAAASEEQSATADEINGSTHDVTVLADNVGTGIHYTASIARDLVAISDNLTQIINDLQTSSKKS